MQQLLYNHKSTSNRYESAIAAPTTTIAVTTRGVASIVVVFGLHDEKLQSSPRNSVMLHDMYTSRSDWQSAQLLHSWRVLQIYSLAAWQPVEELVRLESARRQLLHKAKLSLLILAAQFENVASMLQLSKDDGSCVIVVGIGVGSLNILSPDGDGRCAGVIWSCLV